MISDPKPRMLVRVNALDKTLQFPPGVRKKGRRKGSTGRLVQRVGEEDSLFWQVVHSDTETGTAVYNLGELEEINFRRVMRAADNGNFERDAEVIFKRLSLLLD